MSKNDDIKALHEDAAFRFIGETLKKTGLDIKIMDTHYGPRVELTVNGVTYVTKGRSYLG